MTVRVRCCEIGAVVLCLLLGGALAPSTAAQDRSGWPGRLSHLPLGEALLAFQEATGLDLSYDPVLVEGKRTATVDPAETTAEAVLQAMLEGTGLAFYRLSSGTYALRPEAAEPLLPGRLAGVVVDGMSGLPLQGAYVVLAGRKGGTATTATGAFRFRDLPPGRYALAVTHLGYDPFSVTVEIRPEAETELHVDLRSKPVPIAPVVVESFQPRMGMPVLDATQQEELAQVLGLGTADAVRSLNDLMGVRVGDALADVHIQGGEAGEHQFQLDGVPVFEPVHLRGLLGAFNPFAIDRITVHKAGFGVAQGSYLAGVIEAEHALRSADGHPLDIQVDPLSVNGRMYLETGREDGLQAVFMAAARTSVWNVYSPPHLDSLLLSWNTSDEFLLRYSLLALRERDVDQYDLNKALLESLPPPTTPDLGFGDVHLAGRLRLTDLRTLGASYYRGANRLTGRSLSTPFDTVGTPTDPSPTPADTTSGSAPNDEYQWINENAQVSYAQLLGTRAYLSLQARSSLYNLSHQYTVLGDSLQRFPFPGGDDIFVRFDLAPADDGNRIRELGLRSTLHYAHGFGQGEAGLELAHTAHRFSVADAFVRTILHAASDWRGAFFVEEEIPLSAHVTVTGGVRLTYLRQREAVYPEPRVEVRLDRQAGPAGPWSARLAAGRYHQFFNQVDISNISPSALFPSIRFWMPVDSSIAPPRAYHVAGDLVAAPSPFFSVRLEAYYKHQPHLLLIDYASLWAPDTDGGADSTVTLQSDFFLPSRGYAYGSALALDYTRSHLRTKARYEYGIARRRYAFRDTTARLLSAPWNEPHRLELAMDWLPHDRLITTARWRSGWGRTWGYRKAYYDFLGTNPTLPPVLGEIDFRRPEDDPVPAFHQLDVGVAYTHPLGPTAVQLRLDILNLLDRRNVSDYALVETAEGEPPLSVRRTTMDRTVSMAVRLKW